MKKKLNNIIEVVSYVVMTVCTWFFSYSAMSEAALYNHTFEIVENKYLICLTLMIISAVAFYRNNREEAAKEIAKSVLISSSMTTFNMLYFKDVNKIEIMSNVGVIISQLLLQIFILNIISFVAKSIKLHEKRFAIAEIIGVIFLIIVTALTRSTVVFVSIMVALIIIDLIVGFKIYSNKKEA